MRKTSLQALVESQHQKPLGEVLIDAFEAHRGEPNMLLLVAVQLGVSDTTVHSWCRQLQIDVSSFRSITAQQEILELKSGKDIRTLVVEVLERHRGKKRLPMIAALELEITTTSLYLWCKQLQIDVSSFRYPVPEPVVEAGD